MARSIGIILLFVLHSVLFGEPSQKKSVVLAIGEWAPFTSEKYASYGAVTEIVTLIFRKSGYEPTYQFFPWKRCEESVKNGVAFASFPYIKTEERAAKYDYSDVILDSPECLFYLKKRFHKGVFSTDFTDLREYRFGGTIGYWYEQQYKDAKLTAEFVPSDDQNFKKIYDGRIDLFTCNEMVGWEIISRVYPKEKHLFGTNRITAVDGALHLLVSRSYPQSKQVLEDFNRTLAIVKKSGEIEKILKNRGVSN